MAIRWIRRLFDEDEFFEFNLKFLLYVGLWPKQNWPKLQTLLYKVYEVSIHVLSVIFLIISGIGTYQNRHDVTVFLSSLDKSLVGYNFFLKSVLFVWKRKRVRELIAKICNSGDTITEKRRQLMTSHVVMVTIFCTSILGAFSALAQYKFEMTVEAWMPFDPMKNRMSLLLAAQLLAVNFVPPMYRSCALQGIVCSLIMYVCDQLIDVQNRLRNLRYSTETEAEMREEFKQIIKKHVRLMGYSKELDSIFKEFFLVQNLAVTIELCLSAINVTVIGFKDKSLLASFRAFLALALLNAYIYCYLGNEMISQSAGIALAAYEAPWSSWPIDMQKDLSLVIRMAQKPMQVTAGGMAAMSIQTYSQTLYNGYSIFAVLNDAVD